MRLFLSLIFFGLIITGISVSYGDAALPREKLVVLVGQKVRATLRVELAITPRDQERGLMGRKNVPKDTGMLFLFDRDRIAHFWMRGTLVPLDMIFIDHTARITRIHAQAQPLDETYIRSSEPVRAVLEIGGGQARLLRLKVGQRVSSPTLDKMLERAAKNL